MKKELKIIRNYISRLVLEKLIYHFELSDNKIEIKYKEFLEYTLLELNPKNELILDITVDNKKNNISCFIKSKSFSINSTVI